MDRFGGMTTTCRCGYASPATVARCLGCNRRFAPTTCARVPVAAARPATTVRPEPAPVATAAPTRPAPVEPPPLASPVPVGGLAVLGLVAAAFTAPEEARVPVLTAAAVLGAAATIRPVVPAAPADPVSRADVEAHPSWKLSDDELRDAIAAW